jgi:hypothetical protein
VLAFADLKISGLISSPGSDKAKKDALRKAFDDVTASKKALDDCFQAYNQDVITSLAKDLHDAQDASFANLAKVPQTKITANENIIKDYMEARQKLLGDRAGDPAGTVASELGIPPSLPDPTSAGPACTTPDGRPLINPDDLWTFISVSVAESNSSSNSYSLGAGASWGL